MSVASVRKRAKKKIFPKWKGPIHYRLSSSKSAGHLCGEDREGDIDAAGNPLCCSIRESDVSCEECLAALPRFLRRREWQWRVYQISEITEMYRKRWVKAARRP